MVPFHDFFFGGGGGVYLLGSYMARQPRSFRFAFVPIPPFRPRISATTGALGDPLRDPLRAPKWRPCSTPPEVNFSMKILHKIMKVEVPEAEILRTPIKIEKLSLWNRSGAGFIVNFEFHGFLEKNTPPIYFKRDLF